jgi:hypothetical protein
VELQEIASTSSLSFLDSALEIVNEASYELFGEPLVEPIDEDAFEINGSVVKRMLNE